VLESGVCCYNAKCTRRRDLFTYVRLAESNLELMFSVETIYFFHHQIMSSIKSIYIQRLSEWIKFILKLTEIGYNDSFAK
jgi:hypothetical protein